MKLPTFIKQLVRLCDQESSRYALGGVKCESRDGVSKLTATDGRILASVSYGEEDASPPDVDVIINGKSLAACLTPAALKSGEPQLTGDNLTCGRSVMHPETVEGRFPRYEDVFSIHDEPDGYVSVKLDPVLLRKLCDLHAAAQDEANKGIVLWVKDSSSAVFTSGTHCEHTIRGAVMPLACDGPNDMHEFPARPGAESNPQRQHAESEQANESTPAPVSEMPNDAPSADSVTREPEPVSAGCMAYAVPAIE